MPLPSPNLTCFDAARVLNVSVDTVREEIRRGNLASVRLSARCIRITPEALQAYIQARTRPISPPPTSAQLHA